MIAKGRYWETIGERLFACKVIRGLGGSHLPLTSAVDHTLNLHLDLKTYSILLGDRDFNPSTCSQRAVHGIYDRRLTRAIADDTLFPFFALSRELRDAVYRDLTIDKLGPETPARFLEFHSFLIVRLRLICRQFKEEYEAEVFRSSILALYTTPIWLEPQHLLDHVPAHFLQKFELAEVQILGSGALHYSHEKGTYTSSRHSLHTS